MMHWLHQIRRMSRFGDVGDSHTSARKSRKYRPRVENLEDRCVPSTFTVLNTNDNGPDSLRDAIQKANSTPGADEIDFNIGQGGPQQIDLQSFLPAITDSVTINGTTQPGFAGTALIKINGGTITGSFSPLIGPGLLIQAPQCTVEGLIVAAFTGQGIVLQSNGNTVQNNIIGSDSVSVTGGNGDDGILIAGSNNAILNNLIDFNAGNGVNVASGTGNSILGNSIQSNSKLGIDLGNDGVTPNDPGDADTGPNGLQNFPVLTFANVAPNGIAVQGKLSSTPNSKFTIELFVDSTSDPSGFGEGDTFAQRLTVMTDAGGNAAFSAFLTPIPGSLVTATATNAKNNTSEFSAGLNILKGATIPAPSAPVLLATDDTGSSNTDHVTRVNLLHFQGTATPGVEVDIIASTFGTGIQGQIIGRATADAAGNYLVAATVPLPDDFYQIVAQAVASGVLSPFSNPMAPSLTIDTAAPVVTGADVHALQGRPFTINSAAFTDQPLAFFPSQFIVTFIWGDGQASSGDVTFDENSNTFFVSGGHTYANEGILPIRLQVTDLAGNTGFAINTASIFGFVTSLYQNVLLRQPDAAGLNFWVQMERAGATRAQVAGAFWLSSEHNGVLVDQIYTQILHHAADPAGRAFWVHALDIGAATTTDLALTFLTSTEYTATHFSNAAFVTGLYQNIFGRAPDANAGFWTQILNNNARTRQEVAYYFLTSTEAYVDAVNDYYVTFLGRPVDSASLNTLMALAARGQVTPLALAELVLGSNEYLAHVFAKAAAG
jgi:hypothetical protein